MLGTRILGKTAFKLPISSAAHASIIVGRLGIAPLALLTRASFFR